MATLYKPDGSSFETLPAAGGRFTLKELQKIVGGYIEVLTMADGRLMVINEDGKAKELLRNEQATGLAYFAGIDRNDYIAGDALLCTEGELDGDDEDEEDEDFPSDHDEDE